MPVDLARPHDRTKVVCVEVVCTFINRLQVDLTLPARRRSEQLAVVGVLECMLRQPVSRVDAVRSSDVLERANVREQPLIDRAGLGTAYDGELLEVIREPLVESAVGFDLDSETNSEQLPYQWFEVLPKRFTASDDHKGWFQSIPVKLSEADREHFRCNVLGLHAHRARRVLGVTQRALKVAAVEPHEDAGGTGERSFALDGVED